MEVQPGLGYTMAVLAVHRILFSTNELIEEYSEFSCL